MQVDQLKRREFIALLGGAAASWPLAARAQQRMRRVGALMGVAPSNGEAQVWLLAFKRALQELGWIEGRNIVVDVRWPAGDVALMKGQASELANNGSEVVLTHASPATAALRQAAPNLPNVFVTVIDPVGSGFVESITRPGGASTGFTNFEPSLSTKWLELLKAIVPRLTRVLVLANPNTHPGGFGGALPLALRASAPSFGVAVIDTPFGAAEEIDVALTRATNDSGTGMIVMPDTSTTLHTQSIVDSAGKHHIPSVYPYRDFVEAGGLMAYSVDRTDLYRRAAVYVDRILKGDKPSELPVQAPTKFELSINLKTAKALGLDMPPTLLALADDVIE
jgi:putative ABC transport system substrate-binding protein